MSVLRRIDRCYCGATLTHYILSSRPCCTTDLYPHPVTHFNNLVPVSTRSPLSDRLPTLTLAAHSVLRTVVQLEPPSHR